MNEMNNTNDPLAFVKMLNETRSNERRRRQNEERASLNNEYISETVALRERVSGYQRENKVIQNIVYGCGAILVAVGALSIGALFVLCV